MSFIKRSDGTVVHSGGHVGSRGTLESVKHSGGESYNLSEEDKKWEKVVLASSVSMEDSLHLSLMEDTPDEEHLSSNLWGVYYQKPTHIRSEFEGCFTPSDH